MGKTLIIGASTNPERYAYRAAERLMQYGHETVLLGRRAGQVLGQPIHTEKKLFDDIETVTLYLSAKNQTEYYDYILALHPRRVVFNPGTENPELQRLLSEQGIAWEEACTLVMLATGQY